MSDREGMRHLRARLFRNTVRLCKRVHGRVNDALPPQARRPVAVAGVLTLLTAASYLPSAVAREKSPQAAVPPSAPREVRVTLSSMAQRQGRFVADVEGGGLAELTINPAMQASAEELLASYEIPYGAVVAVSIPDGRVLALAGRSARDPDLGPEQLALRPWAPAASVFKIVAGSALVQQGLTAGTRVCYHGGVSSVLADNLVDLPRIDKRCDTLGYAMGKSQNAIFAKLADRHLSPDILAQVAESYGFGATIPLEARVEPSSADIPQEKLEFARAAAGFWHSSLSVLHGALIAAAVANEGEMPMPTLVAKAVGPDGSRLPLPARRLRRVMDPIVAREVGRMMEMTTSMGTARSTFRDRRGQAFLPINVAGKTGSLAYRGRPEDPTLPAAAPPEGGYLGYSWFVGYAPTNRPKIAFAVLIGNSAQWRIKAPYVARQVIARYLASTGTEPVTGTLASR